jgi:hypothetical protein
MVGAGVKRQAGAGQDRIVAGGNVAEQLCKSGV